MVLLLPYFATSDGLRNNSRIGIKMQINTSTRVSVSSSRQLGLQAPVACVRCVCAVRR